MMRWRGVLSWPFAPVHAEGTRSIFLKCQRFQQNTEQLFCGHGIMTVRFQLVDNPALRTDVLPGQCNNFLRLSEVWLSQFACSRNHIRIPKPILRRCTAQFPHTPASEMSLCYLPSFQISAASFHSYLLPDNKILPSKVLCHWTVLFLQAVGANFTCSGWAELLHIQSGDLRITDLPG
jgi:hypothetical protein